MIGNFTRIVVVGDVLQRRDDQSGLSHCGVKLRTVRTEVVHLFVQRNLGSESNRLRLERCVAGFGTVGQHYPLAMQVARAPIAGTGRFKISLRYLHRRGLLRIILIGKQQRRGELNIVSFEIFGNQVKLKIFISHPRPKKRLQLVNSADNQIALLRIIEVRGNQGRDAHAAEGHLTIIRMAVSSV